MATCYRCGRPIPSTEFKLRRKVKTGERLYRRYPNPQVSSLHTTYGIRLVCSVCAAALDWDERRRMWLQWLELAFALILLTAAVVTRHLTG